MELVPHITVGVVPILIGPLQALLALLPVILLALGSMAVAFFKPRNAWVLVKLLWRQKLAVVVLVGLGVGVWMGVGLLPARAGGGDAVLVGDVNWFNFRGGLQRRGYHPGTPDPTAPGVQWTYRTANDAAIYASPAIAGDYVIFATARVTPFDPTGSGELLCLNAHTGELVWRGGLSDLRATFSSPVVQGDYVAIGEGLHLTRDSRVSVFNSRTGALRWSYRTQSHAESTPAIAGGRVFAGAGRDGYRAFDLEPDANGKPKLHWHAPGARYMDASGSPNVYGDHVFVPMGRWGGLGMACLDADSGEERWRVTTPYPVFSGPTIVAERNLVLIGMGNGNFVQTAEQAMPSQLDYLRAKGATDQELEEARELLGPAGEVWAIDLTTGDLRWRFASQRTVLGQVAAGPDAVYFGSRDGHLYRVDYQGRETARWNARSPIIASPAVAEDHVYVVSASGVLYCLDARSLRVVWEMPLQRQPLAAGDLFISSPVVAHGRVYVGTPRSGLLAVGKPTPPLPLIWAGEHGGPGGDGRLGTSTLPQQVEPLWFLPWQHKPDMADCPVTGSVALHADAAFVPLQQDGQFGLARLPLGPDAPTQPVWFTPTGLPVVHSPATDGHTVFLSTGRPGDTNRRVLALDASTGSLRWERPLHATAPGFLHLTHHALVVADEALLSLDPASGQPQWRWDQAQPASAGAVRHGRVVVTSKDSVYLLDEASGSVLWSQRLEEANLTAGHTPVFAGRGLIVIATDTRILALSELDGATVWEAPLATPLVDSIVLVDDRVVVVRDRDEHLSALSLQDGRLLLEVPQVSLPVLADESAVYVMGRRGFQRVPLDGARPAGWMRWEEDDWGLATARPLAAGYFVLFVTERGLLAAEIRSEP